MNPPADPDTQTLVFRRGAGETTPAGRFPEDLREWQSAVVLARRVRQAMDLPPEAKSPPAAEALPAVLLWCLATGRYGSNDIAALFAEEPMCRHLGGGHTFSWGEVQRFRREQRGELATWLARLLVFSWPGSPNDCAPGYPAEAERRLDLATQTDHRELED
jgi:hypothetical protein